MTKRKSLSKVYRCNPKNDPVYPLRSLQVIHSSMPYPDPMMLNRFHLSVPSSPPYMPKRNCDLIQHNKQQQQRGYLREETSKKRKKSDSIRRTRTCDNVTKENNANETCSPGWTRKPTLLWKLRGAATPAVGWSRRWGPPEPRRRHGNNVPARGGAASKMPHSDDAMD
jgi:hypothetical protein